METDKAVKKSVSFPKSVLTAVEKAAGNNVSGWVADACRKKLDGKGPPDTLSPSIVVDLVRDTLGRRAAEDVALALASQSPATPQPVVLEDILRAYVASLRSEQHGFVAEPRAAGDKR